jgi:hypothetical protein
LSYWALDSTFIAIISLMKSHLTLLTALLITLVSFSQQKNNVLHLRSGAVSLKPGISPAHIDSLNRKIARFGRAFMLIQFDELPNELTKQQLSAQGIELLNYISDNAYTASIKGNLNTQVLLQSKARAIHQLTPEQKIDPVLASGMIPANSKKPGTVDVSISFPKTYNQEEIVSLLKPLNAEIISSDLISYRILNLRIALHKIFQLAEQPFVEYVLPVSPPLQPLLNQSKILSHANVLNASASNGGKGLKGEGVIIGVGDQGELPYHLDFKDRFINNTTSGQEVHGVLTSGIAAGGGNVEELYTGYAPKAKIISGFFNSILNNAPAYVQAYNMVVTNNSYGGSIGCETNGRYDFASAFVDQQAFDLPYLQHVFAAGNSGGQTCASFPAGFKTVLGGFQAAKNTLCVGSSDDNGNIAPNSSRGPVRDGRVKPDIMAKGYIVTSSAPGNVYWGDNGTSLSAPAVAGGIALLYQRYRQLHANTNPKSALIKALACNGAADRGNPGPDFKYGFGSMDLLRSVDMLDNARYFTNASTNNSTQDYSISVPANTAKVKIMLYWHDPVPSMIAAKTLVNDLDLEVINPSSATILPLILDSTAVRVNDVAITGADHTNNMEQVVITNPTAGNYGIKIKGTAIGQNPSQEYFVVYDIIPNSIQLTYPMGGDGVVPGEYTRIAWDAYGDETTSFSLQYSIDNGSSWIDINNNLPAGMQFYWWLVPAVSSDKALIRITKNATGQVSTSHSFTIIGVPSISLTPVQCEGYININWAAIAGATDYELMMLHGDEMTSVGYTTNTFYSFNSLSKDSIYLVSVRARVNGKWGRRATGLIRQPFDGNCSGSISDNDLQLQAILSPTSGRKFTSSQLSALTPVIIEIKNLDDAPVTGFIVKYSIDNGINWFSENVSATIAAGAVYTHNFANTVNFSAIGNYNLIAVVNNNTVDIATGNDTLKRIIKHIDNQPINLATRFFDNLESAVVNTYQADTIGLSGAERYDFENSNAYGRLRTFFYNNSGMAYSGSKAFTLDVDREISQASNANRVIGTFNLSNYDATVKELRLDFRFITHGFNTKDSTRVWIRGDDNKPWIEMFYLMKSSGSGVYILSPSIEIGDSLLKYGQNFSSGFQVKWGQLGSNKAVSKSMAAGISFDDIRLYEVKNDMQMLAIDTPALYNCGLSAAFPLKITLRNTTKNAINNLPVKYSINGSAWVTETIPTFPGETSLQYVFNNKPNFSGADKYLIKAIVDYPGDDFRDNDTATITAQNVPIVNSFPHIQNFEDSDGGWHTEGAGSSWAYGIPASIKINRAASGTKAWKTNLNGNYNDAEFSYLYSPCYQIEGLRNPTLSFSAAFDLENCGTTLCDYVALDYSLDGQEWQHLTADSLGVNWYKDGINNVLWSMEDYTRWHVVTASLPKNVSTIRFRFILGTDAAVNREGVAIDDIHVYDNTKGIYDGVTTSSPITQTISGGNNWIHFEKDGRLIASIQPNGQNLGITNVQAFIHSGVVRNTGSQYYHNRNITIKPGISSLTDSAIIRFYFLDTETEALINATGCTGCAKSSNAYELGVSQYDDYDLNFENGSIDDNQQGLWTFINSDKAVKVPFDRGYYTEFKVKDFSEFWLNNGSPDRSTPLPVKFLNFSVQKTGTEDVTINWAVGSENNVARYEIEIARTDADLQSGNFQKIGEVTSQGNSTTQQQYGFIDKETFKNGARYYRIKIINKDGSFTYSLIRSLVFNSITTMRVLPNPSPGLFYLVYQANTGETVNMQLTDAIGKLIKTYINIGNGSPQKLTIDLSGFAAGIYMLQIQVNGKLQTFKLYKK